MRSTINREIIGIHAIVSANDRIHVVVRFRKQQQKLLDIGMGIVGHSYGGPTTAIVCRDDERFTCGIGLDSGAFGLQGSDLKKPFLLLFSEPNYNMNAIIGANNSMDTYYFSVDQRTATQANPAGEPFVVPANNRRRRPSIRMSDYAHADVKQQSALKDGIQLSRVQFDKIIGCIPYN